MIHLQAFPACAGMNRSDVCINWELLGVPRMRGDEPPPYAQVPMTNDAFPACAGMNRHTFATTKLAFARSPHARG